MKVGAREELHSAIKRNQRESLEQCGIVMESIKL